MFEILRTVTLKLQKTKMTLSEGQNALDSHTQSVERKKKMRNSSLFARKFSISPESIIVQYDTFEDSVENIESKNKNH